MQVFRYNTIRREDRKYNTTGREKNPNAVKFYAIKAEYAERYRYVYDADGDIAYECALEVLDVDMDGLFDMANNFKSLETYKSYISERIAAMKDEYERRLAHSTKASDKKLFKRLIDDLVNEEEYLIRHLEITEFQALSDFERQNYLVSELKALGYKGYFTNNEVAIF